ncbi:hypothetical protein LguiB_021905 [Lonicera macranthoides]
MSFTYIQINEIALGLEQSEQKFIRVLRDADKGDSDWDWNRAGEVVVAKAVERCVRRCRLFCRREEPNKPPEQGYSHKSSSIGRTPGCGRFTVFGIILGAIFSADDRNLEELPKRANERDGVMKKEIRQEAYSPERISKSEAFEKLSPCWIWTLRGLK